MLRELADRSAELAHPPVQSLIQNPMRVGRARPVRMTIANVLIDGARAGRAKWPDASLRKPDAWPQARASPCPPSNKPSKGLLGACQEPAAASMLHAPKSQQRHPSPHALARQCACQERC